MKKFLFMFIFLISFSLIICQAMIIKEDTLYSKIGQDLCYIEEVGIKLQYSTTKNLIDEINSIESLFKIINKNNIYITDMNKGYYNYSFVDDKYDFKILMTNEKKLINVEIEIIDKTGKANIEIIKNNLEKLSNPTTKDKKYYTYAKGKLNKREAEEKHLENLIDIIGSRDVVNHNTLKINSGITGFIDLKSNKSLNYSIMHYDTDMYLIIGEPVIFTTY